MIPRFKPYLGRQELLAAFRQQEHAVAHFEEAFASTFEARYAVAFRYGRSGLWAFFKALGIEGAEVIMPAFTCVVVAHAVVLSGNIPRFVDVTLYDYNMDLEQVAAAINERTRAIIAIHLFGYPLNVNRLDEIIGAAEARWGHKIWVIQDCAHALGARWQGRLVCNAGDAALFSLHVSKPLTCIAGGMITTNNAEVHQKLRAFRDDYFTQMDSFQRFRTLYHLLKSYPRYNEHVYQWVDWLKENTRLLDQRKPPRRPSAHIRFPQDHLGQMLELEASIGLEQLRKYPELVRHQHENAHYYAEHLRDTPALKLPPLVEGATYSQYVVRVPNRQALLQTARRRNVHLAPWIDYSLPTTPACSQYAMAQEFPNAELCSQTTVSLPVYAPLTEKQRARVVESLQWTCSEKPK